MMLHTYSTVALEISHGFGRAKGEPTPKKLQCRLSIQSHLPGTLNRCEKQPSALLISIQTQHETNDHFVEELRLNWSR